MEGLGFRDRIREFEARRVQILGMSTDSVEANAAFAQRYRFPFPLLSDTTYQVCRAYGVCDSPGTSVANRVTFVIGSDRRILRVYEDVRPEEHADAILEFLNEIAERSNVAGSVRD